jgi:tetratricopeptide (TPR) repeat protein
LKDYQASLKQYFAARELLTPICRDVPDHSRAWRTFWHTFTNPVATYTGMKQYEQALDQLQAYLRQRGEGASDRDRLHEAWLLDQLQRYDDAIEALDGCVERYRGAPAMKAVATKASQLAERHQEAEGEKPPEAYLKRLHDIAKL